VLAAIAKRLGIYLLVFAALTVGLFALVHAIPGDPVRLSIDPAQMAAGGPAYVARQRHALGLDSGLPVQYGVWLRNALGGNLGYSYVDHQPVTAVLAERIGPTAELMGLAFAVSLVVGIPLGVLAATHRNTVLDYCVTGFATAAVSIPPFVLGLLGIAVFSLALRWLPSAGMSTPGAASLPDELRHLVLPVLILGLAAAGPITRYVRSGLIGELGQDYTRTATAKGASPARVTWRHAFRNSSIPLVSVVAISIPVLLGGAVVIEQVFAWPGLGQLVISSVTQNDYPVLIGFGLYVAILVLVSNAAADILYTVVDPRTRQR
jgi:peptide/nickel transport system permease protein